MQPIARFGKAVAERFAAGGGEPEEQLRGPLEQLIDDLASAAELTNVVLVGEHQLAADRVRPTAESCDEFFTRFAEEAG